MKSNLSLIVFAALLIQFGCKEPPSTKEELTKYIKDESNGLSISKKTGIFELNVTFIPTKLRILQEGIKSSQNQDSLSEKMNQSLLFTFIISPLEGKTEGDVFLSGVSSKQDYEERVRKANFGFSESWSLHLDNSDALSPIGVQMEQTNGLTDHRIFHILFDASQNKEVFESKTWDLKLNDDLFNSGIHHFVIMKKDRNRMK